MTVQELEASALKLTEAERAELAERLLASIRHRAPSSGDDPIWEMGSDPAEGGPTDGSVNHDRYLYGSPD